MREILIDYPLPRFPILKLSHFLLMVLDSPIEFSYCRVDFVNPAL